MYRLSSIVALLLLVAVVAVAPASNAAPVKEWTVAVFLNADNNLDPFGVEDQEEMAKVGSNDWLNMVTLIDREKGPACYNYIEKGKVTKVKDAGEMDMGDYKEMVSFMKWVVANYPAKKYVLTIWNHGSGWKQAKHGIVRGISYDDSSNNHITTAQLGIALKEIKGVLGKNLDILNMDACLMQMVEVNYATKDYCDFVVASEEVEPGKGTPYDDVFATLAQTSTAESFSKSWVKAFVSSYSKGSQGQEACTQSTVKSAAVSGLVDAVNGFAKATMAGNYSKEFAAALGKVQKFSYPENVDLIHLATLVKATVKDEGMQTACNKLLTACKAAIVANGSSQMSMKNSKGIAIYFPADMSSFESSYNSLEFTKVSLWDEMVKDFFQKKTANALIKTIESGDLSALRDYIAKSSDKDRDFNKLIVQLLNFRIYTEGGLPASIMTELEPLLKELASK